MNEKDKIFLMQQISNMRVAMEQIGETKSVVKDNDKGLLFSIRFKDKSLNIASNEIIHNAVEKIRERFNLKNFYAGSTVLGWVEKRVG